MKAFPQPTVSQAYGLSFVCVLVCFFRSLLVVNNLLQPSSLQLKVSPEMITLSWLTREKKGITHFRTVPAGQTIRVSLDLCMELEVPYSHWWSYSWRWPGWWCQDSATLDNFTTTARIAYLMCWVMGFTTTTTTGIVFQLNATYFHENFSSYLPIWSPQILCYQTIFRPMGPVLVW